MARLVFNPEVPTSNDPSYLGYSRETSGDRSMATLFAGMGDMLGKAVKAVDEDNQAKIKAELSTGVGEVNDLYSALGTTEEAEDQDEENTTYASDELAGNPGGDVLTNATPDGGVAVNDARRLTLAVKEGKITPEHYWSRMEVLSKKLKARYPAYGDVIDRQFQGVTGAMPANALAQARRNAYNSSLTQADKEAKEWRTYIKANEQYLPPDYYKRMEEGNPYKQDEIQERIRSLKTRDYEFKVEENKWNRQNREGEADSKKVLGLATQRLNSWIDTVLSDSTAPFKDITGLLNKAQQDFKSLSPEDKQQMSLAFSQLRVTADRGADKILSEAWDDGKTNYYGAIGDPSKIKALKEQALSRIDNFQKMLDDKDFGILNSTVNYNKAVQDRTTQKLLDAHDYFGKVAAVKELGGGELINQMFLDQKWNANTDAAAKAFRDLTILDTVTGKDVSTREQLEEAKKTADQMNVNGPTQKKLFRQVIDDKLTILQSENANLESYQGAATALFGPKNRDFLRVFPRSEQKHEIYMKLTSPQMSARMKKLGETDPSMYSQYKEWAKGSFLQLNQNLAASVQEGVVFREGIDISYDPESSHFVVGTTEKGANRLVELNRGKGGLVSEALKGFEDGLQASSEDAVSKLNRQIDNLKPILTDEKKDINKELEGLFREMGIRTDAGKAKTWFQKARGAILNAIGAETKGSEEKPADAKAQKESGVRSFTQYARAGGVDAKTFLTRVRADGNENVDGLNDEFAGRLSSMLRDAPEEVRNAVKVDSGYRSVEHQRRLWNAALAKYGSVRAARRWVAPPGHSYHGKGLAVDLKYASPDAREWIRDNAKKYGLHFPLSNENWHIEMAGSRKPKKRTKPRGASI